MIVVEEGGIGEFSILEDRSEIAHTTCGRPVSYNRLQNPATRHRSFRYSAFINTGSVLSVSFPNAELARISHNVSLGPSTCECFLVRSVCRLVLRCVTDAISVGTSWDFCMVHIYIYIYIGRPGRLCGFYEAGCWSHIHIAAVSTSRNGTKVELGRRFHANLNDDSSLGIPFLERSELGRLNGTCSNIRSV